MGWGQGVFGGEVVRRLLEEELLERLLYSKFGYRFRSDFILFGSSEPTWSIPESNFGEI